MKEYKMRRTRQEISLEECEEVLKKHDYGVLSLATKEGEPYGVPLNYAYADGKVIFHGAKKGMKKDMALANDRASFCVVDQSDVVQKELATTYRSVIVQGRVDVIEEKDEMVELLRKMNAQLGPDLTEEESEKGIEKDISIVSMLVLTPEKITGKISLDIMIQRNTKKK